MFSSVQQPNAIYRTSSPRISRLLGTPAVALLASTAFGATLIQPLSSSPFETADPCPVHSDERCHVELFPRQAYLLPVGGSGILNVSMGEQFPDWTVVNGGALAGTLQIGTYDARNDCGLVDGGGGAEFEVFYHPAAGDPRSIVWSQAIRTNFRLSGQHGTSVSYMDIRFDEDPDTLAPPGYPFQYDDYHFYDFSRRPCPKHGVIHWTGDAYVTRLNYGARTMTAYDGIAWGWKFRCWSTSPVVATGGAGDDAPDPTFGSDFATATYDASSETFSVIAPAINFINLTGGSNLEPQFAQDPLVGASIQIVGMNLNGTDDHGGYIFTGGQMMVESAGGVLMTAGMDSILADDSLGLPAGPNAFGIFCDIELPNTLNSPVISMYGASLDENAIPKVTLQTYGPLSQRIADGNGGFSVPGMIKIGFSENAQPLHLIGDANCDGAVNNFDIDAFVPAVVDPTQYELSYPECAAFNVCDINGDGMVNNFDIDPFVELLTGG